jgi:hypothetical protein
MKINTRVFIITVLSLVANPHRREECTQAKRFISFEDNFLKSLKCIETQHKQAAAAASTFTKPTLVTYTDQEGNSDLNTSINFSSHELQSINKYLMTSIQDTWLAFEKATMKKFIPPMLQDSFANISDSTVCEKMLSFWNCTLSNTSDITLDTFKTLNHKTRVLCVDNTGTAHVKHTNLVGQFDACMNSLLHINIMNKIWEFHISSGAH